MTRPVTKPKRKAKAKPHVDFDLVVASGHFSATEAQQRAALREVVAENHLAMLTEFQTAHLMAVAEDFAKNHKAHIVHGKGIRDDDVIILAPEVRFSHVASGHVTATSARPYTNAQTGRPVPAHVAQWGIFDVHVGAHSARISVIALHTPPGVNSKTGGGFKKGAPAARTKAWRAEVRNVKRLSNRLRRAYKIDRKHEFIGGDWNVWFVKSRRLLSAWPLQRLFGANARGMKGFDGILTGATVLHQYEMKKPKGWDHTPRRFHVRVSAK